MHSLAEPSCSEAIAEDENSADEHDGIVLNAEQAELGRTFEQRMAARGLHIKQMARDGNCLFRAIADRVYGDAEMHDVVRTNCMDYLQKERDHFSPYVTQDFDAYLHRKRRCGVYGNHLELQAVSELYARPVLVWAYGDEPINTFQGTTDHAGAPLRLSYIGGNHYNLLYDPTEPDVGLGLGLPGMQPGLADRMQVEEATRVSEQVDLDQQMLQSVAALSDADETQQAIEAEVMRSSLEAAGCDAARHVAAESRSDTTVATDSLLGIDSDPTVQQLLAMGFPLGRARAAADQFGSDLASALEFLTSDC